RPPGGGMRGGVGGGGAGGGFRTAARSECGAQTRRRGESAKKGGRHVATAALSLGRKRPRRAYAAGHAAPQQYRRWPRPLQGLSSSKGQSPTEFEGLWHSGSNRAMAFQSQIDLL